MNPFPPAVCGGVGLVVPDPVVPGSAEYLPLVGALKALLQERHEL